MLYVWVSTYLASQSKNYITLTGCKLQCYPWQRTYFCACCHRCYNACAVQPVTAAPTIKTPQERYDQPHQDAYIDRTHYTHDSSDTCVRIAFFGRRQQHRYLHPKSGFRTTWTSERADIDINVADPIQGIIMNFRPESQASSQADSHPLMEGVHQAIATKCTRKVKLHN